MEEESQQQDKYVENVEPSNDEAEALEQGEEENSNENEIVPNDEVVENQNEPFEIMNEDVELPDSVERNVKEPQSQSNMVIAVVPSSVPIEDNPLSQDEKLTENLTEAKTVSTTNPSKSKYTKTIYQRILTSGYFHGFI